MNLLFFLGVLGCTPKKIPCSSNLYAPPQTFQVAWISKVGDTVGAHESIEVVPMKDLRLWVHNNQASTLMVLQELGMISPKETDTIDPLNYKITIFDVDRKMLCRPIRDAKEGVLRANVQICFQEEITPISWEHRHGFTGCGYAIHSQTQKRSFDVFRVQWLDASSMGFCVFPMKRFLDGA